MLNRVRENRRLCDSPSNRVDVSGGMGILDDRADTGCGGTKRFRPFGTLTDTVSGEERSSVSACC